MNDDLERALDKYINRINVDYNSYKPLSHMEKNSGACDLGRGNYGVVIAGQTITINSPDGRTWTKDYYENHQQKTNERLDAIEEQLVILHRDHPMEEEFEELREAWEQYNKVLEKLRTFKALKDSA